MSDRMNALWSEEAEQSVLGGLLIDPRAWKAVGDTLQRGQFFDPRHAEVFEAIAAVAGSGQPADVLSVFELLRERGKAEQCGGLVYLSQLSHCVPSAANIRRHADIVRDKAAGRALVEAADAALTLAGTAASYGEKLDRIVGLFAALERQQVRKVPRSIAEIAAERVGYYEELQAGTVVPGWPTRIPRLDRMLNGGLRPGGFYILAARPSVGKSSFSQELASTLARDGHPTLFLSQEMPESEVADRSVANAGRIDYGTLMSGRMGDEDWSRAADALEALALTRLYVDDQGGLTLRDIKAKARSVPGLQVLVIDYLQLCSSDRRDANRNAQLEEISRGLKTFAKEAGIAILALSQLNRDVETRSGGGRPKLSDLRDSGAIEQDADVVMFLWPVREFDSHRIVGLGLDKNRQGRCGEFGLDFHGATQRWTESTADITPPARGTGKGRVE